MSLIAGKTTQERKQGGKFFTGYNPAIFRGIKEFTKSDNSVSASLVFNVIDIEGNVNDIEESVYIFTKDGNIDLKVINTLLHALDPDNMVGDALLKEGDTITAEHEAWIQEMGAQGARVSLLMAPKRKEGDKYAYHHTIMGGFLNDNPSIMPASHAGTEMQIDEFVEKGKKGNSSNTQYNTNGASGTPNKSLR